MKLTICADDPAAGDRGFDRSVHLHPFIRREVGMHVQILSVDRPFSIRVEDDDVCVRA